MRELKMNKALIIITLFSLNYTLCQSQNKSPQQLGIMFYNVENLFDTKHDSLKNDLEYLPGSDRHWSENRYNQKIKNIGKVIYESGGWNLPTLIGLCEIENESVLKHLIFNNGLNQLKYNYIHYESNDQRGVDVALLYKRDIFTPLESTPIQVNLNNERPTRDILYVYGLWQDKIPFHLFVCHFPSRYGGIMESAPKRLLACQTLCDTINIIQKQDLKANIIVMGDFNDNPEDLSIKHLIKETGLINLAIHPSSINGCSGTLKHDFEWYTFDQFFISPSLIKNQEAVIASKSMKILDFDFLMEPDSKNTGKKPFRTYIGFKYNNGFSDHLPIWLNFDITY